MSKCKSRCVRILTYVLGEWKVASRKHKNRRPPAASPRSACMPRERVDFTSARIEQMDLMRAQNAWGRSWSPVVRETRLRLAVPGKRQGEGITVKARCNHLTQASPRTLKRQTGVAGHIPDFSSHHLGHQRRKAWYRDAHTMMNPIMTSCFATLGLRRASR